MIDLKPLESTKMQSVDQEGYHLPLSKRQKRAIDNEIHSAPKSGSKIFSPFRTLGLVSPTTVPFTTVRLGKSTFQITTSIGRSLQTYDLRRGLNLVFITRPLTPDTITATCAWQDKIFAAWGNLRPNSPGGIWVFKRGKKIASLDLPADCAGPVNRLLVFGSWVVGCSENCIQVWRNITHDHYTTLRPPPCRGSPERGLYTNEICTMPTYINKVFVGRYDGGVDIWNVKTGKLIYSILPPSSNCGAVTALQPTPVLSLLAIAYDSGTLDIRNIETGRFILHLDPASSSMEKVTSFAFRSDGLGSGDDGRKAGVMATASSESGDIKIWDLNNGGRVMGVLRSAHLLSETEPGSGITHIQFLDGQPVLVSSGKDNSLKTWIFDEVPFSPIPRPLHSRGGHASAITSLGFLPSSSDGSEFGGKWLLSASKDGGLWGFSVRKDSQNTEISQGAGKQRSKRVIGLEGVGGSVQNVPLRTPEITCIACSLNRDGGMGLTTSGPVWTNPKVTNTDASNKTGWESIVTGHKGDKYARTWFWGKKKAGRWAFETSDGSEVKSVAVSHCGTFALVGSAAGSIDMFNLQSGSYRQSFPTRDQRANIKSETKLHPNLQSNNTKHTKAVTGLAIDGLNQVVVSCGLDGKIKFWDFVTGVLVDELNWYPMTSITGLRYSTTSELIAVSCDDLSIRIVDLETRKVVREFWGCVGQVNDLTFSYDGRWVIATSMDSVVRVWDVPTGHLIDLFRLTSTCTALAMSSTGEFLATAHADGVGVSLWSNRGLFTPISCQNLDESIIASVDFQTAAGENGGGAIEAAFFETPSASEVEGPLLNSQQLDRDMLTLSKVPKSKWQTLLNLHIIKERNKPVEPPKAPQKAPFFLPAAHDASESDTNIGFDRVTESTVTERSRIAKMYSPESSFVTLLKSGSLSGDFESFIEHLKSLPPAKVDVEIRSLSPQVQEGQSELSAFVCALSSQLRSKKDFELVNAWMAVFLKAHCDVIERCSGLNSDEYSVLKDSLDTWVRVQRIEARRLTELVGYCRGVVGFLRSSR